jgi:hypothetical protein
VRVATIFECKAIDGCLSWRVCRTQCSSLRLCFFYLDVALELSWWEGGHKERTWPPSYPCTLKSFVPSLFTFRKSLLRTNSYSLKSVFSHFRPQLITTHNLSADLNLSSHTLVRNSPPRTTSVQPQISLPPFRNLLSPNNFVQT